MTSSHFLPHEWGKHWEDMGMFNPTANAIAALRFVQARYGGPMELGVYKAARELAKASLVWIQEVVLPVPGEPTPRQAGRAEQELVRTARELVSLYDQPEEKEEPTREELLAFIQSATEYLGHLNAGRGSLYSNAGRGSLYDRGKVLLGRAGRVSYD